MTIPSDEPGISERLIRRLARSMRREGWVGASIVMLDRAVVSGEHRLRAMLAAGLSFAPTEDLREIFTRAGLDFDTLWREAGSPEPGTRPFARLLHRLPARIRREYDL